MNSNLKLTIVLIVICVMNSYAGTTGKIHGRITNSETGEPIPGISVIVGGTKIGAASNYEGNYFIINVPPGVYKLETYGVGYKKTLVELVKVYVDKSTKVDFELKYSDEYELTEKMEQFYLQKLTPDQQTELMNLKNRNKLEYQRQLLKIFYTPHVKSGNQSEFIFQNILQITKQIDELGAEYQLLDSEEVKKQKQQEMMDLLEKRFSLREQKMQLEIQKLTQGIEELKKELEKFRDDKDMIIKKQFESYIEK